MICQAPLTQEAPRKVRKEYVREEMCDLLLLIFFYSILLLEMYGFYHQ